MAEHKSNMPETFLAFFATPKDEQKEFKRKGGFIGTATSPFYLIKRLTERFGLCGKGWKIKYYHTERVETKEGEVLVYVLLSLLYKEEGDTEWNEVGPHYGGDIAVEMLKSERQQKNLDGTYKLLGTDDEAFKKAYTDAFSKCCSWIGLAGDIHDGMAGDSKYSATKPWDVSVAESVATLRRQQAPAAAPEPPPVSAPVPEPAPVSAEATEPAPAAAPATPAPEAPKQGTNEDALKQREAQKVAYRTEKAAAMKRLIKQCGGNEDEAKAILADTEKAFGGEGKAQEVIDAIKALAPAHA